MTAGSIRYTRTGCLVTRAGVVIGGAHIRPLPRVVSADACKIQRLLLAPPPGRARRVLRALDDLIRWIVGF